MPLASGTRLGPYEVTALIGAGGMGEVYKARDTRLERDVAVKIIHPHVAADPQRVSRFENEARAAARLDHPNILVVHDVGTHDGSPYLVTELLDGESLRAKLEAPLAPHTAVDYVVQAARGLAAAHEKGIVHRDLKPENLFVTRDGRVKILDFGIAKLRPSTDAGAAATEAPTASSTQAGIAVGTVGYMPPEQIRGDPVDARSDLFSLGIVLYELLAGRRPFMRETAVDTMHAILREEPADLASAAPGVPPMLERIVRHCLEKDPANRPQSVREVIVALETLSGPSGQMPTHPMVRPGGWLRRYRAAVAVVTALVAVLAVVGALALRLVPRAPASGGSPSVLALPCKVYGAPEVAYLTDAVPGTISTLLAQVEGLDTKVPPSSLEVEKLKGDLGRLAELYQVSSFIVTSVTASRENFALNVQLVDAATKKLRWGHQYEGPREAYNDLARQAAEGIRQAVKPTTSPVPTAAVSSEAELAFREGNYFSARHYMLFRRSDFEAALAAYRRALALAPTLAAAAGNIAHLYMERFDVEGDVHQARREAESWARRALGMDPRCGEAWAALSGVEMYATPADPERGIDYAVKAVAFAPRDAWVHTNLGLWVAGPGAQSLTAVINQHALEIDPVSVPVAGLAGVALAWVGQPAEALAIIDRALRMEPEFTWGLMVKGLALLKLGRLEEAEGALRLSEAAATASHSYRELWRQIRLQLAVAQQDAATSDILARQVVAAALDPRAEANLVGNAQVFGVPALARMGRTDDAMRVLVRSVEAGVAPAYDFLLRDPDLQRLRSDPRFGKVLAAARDGAAMVARILGQARARGELPAYLEKPLDELVQLLKENDGRR